MLSAVCRVRGLGVLRPGCTARCVQRMVGSRAVRGTSRDGRNRLAGQEEEEYSFLEYDSTEKEGAAAPEIKGQVERSNYELQIQKEYEERIHALEAETERRSKLDVHQHALQQQIKALNPLLEKIKVKDAHYREDLEFKDIGYTSVQNRRQKIKGEHKIYGSPDPNISVSGQQCSGCGAVMHCLDPSVPGYIPSEKYANIVQDDKDLGEAICQRCFLLVHHQKALNVTVSQEEYRKIVSSIRTKKALVLLMVDMLDLPNSVIPDLLDLVGKTKNIFVLGNKVDLLPGDTPGYLKRMKNQLVDYCTKAGINTNMTDVQLISAKTGYGVELLISKLQNSWKYKGDVYLVGATNAGKSTLFNTLLQSDYCKAKASEIIKQATISPWPGTTMNLLKFPIVNPTPYRMFQRLNRLKMDRAKSEEELDEEEQKSLNRLRQQGYVIGRVGRTFHRKAQKIDIEFDADLLAFSTEDDVGANLSDTPQESNSLTYNEIKDAHWFYDTPGIVKEGCVLAHLNDKEVKIVQPTQAIIPRTFVLQPGMTLFLGALGRIDLLQAEQSAWFSVIASNLVPVHITATEKADDIYQKHAGKTLLGVPIGGEPRMKEFPPLVSQDITLEGAGPFDAVADIMLSTAGWVAVTAHSGQKLFLRCYTPEGTRLMIRKPPLLPRIVNIKGERIRKSPAYATKKPQPLVKM
ncbi:nitric oxide-associated protein 1 [Discoglossus pictus]